jgi:hypothetical protein
MQDLKLQGAFAYTRMFTLFSIPQGQDLTSVDIITLSLFV